MMKISFLKSKIRSLRKYDLFKAVIDILLPDLANIGDFNPLMNYRKGDRVYYYDQSNDVSRIIEATEDIIATGGDIDPSQWSVVSGNSLPNANLLKNLEINDNNNLMYKNTILNNVHVSADEPEMNEKDLWFGLTKRVDDDNDNDVEDGGNGESPSLGDNTLVIKNMVVQDDQPADNTYLWGDIEEDKEENLDSENQPVE